jgi:hypothetical protein
MESFFKSRINLPPIKEIDFASSKPSSQNELDPFEYWKDDPDSGINKKQITIDIDSCPYCFNTDCLDTSDLITCKECGYVVARPFDNSAEYRYFSQEDRGGDPTRVGAPQDPRLPEASLGTVILNGYGTAKTMYRVRKYHSWNTVPYKERSFIQTCERLSLIGLNKGINQSIIEEAKSLFSPFSSFLPSIKTIPPCLYPSIISFNEEKES